MGFSNHFVSQRYSPTSLFQAVFTKAVALSIALFSPSHLYQYSLSPVDTPDLKV